MGNKYSKGLIAKFFSPIRELLFRNVDLLLPVSLSSWTWSKMERDNLIPFSLPSFLLELFHMSRCCWEDGLGTRANCDVRTPGKEREKPRTHEAVGMRLLGQRIMRKRGPVPMREVGIIHRTRWGIACWGILTVYTPAFINSLLSSGNRENGAVGTNAYLSGLDEIFQAEKDSEFTLRMPVPHPHNCLNLYHLEEKAVRKPLSPSSWLPFKSHRCLSCPKAIRSDV